MSTMHKSVRVPMGEVQLIWTICSVVPVQVPEGKQKCPDGTLRSHIFIPRTFVRRKFGPFYPIAYKVLEHFLGGL